MGECECKHGRVLSPDLVAVVEARQKNWKFRFAISVQIEPGLKIACRRSPSRCFEKCAEKFALDRLFRKCTRRPPIQEHWIDGRFGCSLVKGGNLIDRNCHASM